MTNFIGSKPTSPFATTYYRLHDPERTSRQHPKNLYVGVDATVPILRAFNQARDRVELGRDITFHSLHHSLATHLLERGAPAPCGAGCART